MIINQNDNLNDGVKFNLADFFVAGTPRSGTTSLYQYMYFHPEILLSSPKEPRFFVFRGLNKEELSFESPVVLKASILDFKKYSRMFKNSGGKLCGDFTVTSLKYYKQFIKNVKELYSGLDKPKIIIALRNPIEATYSYYNYLYMSREIKENDFLAFLKKCKKEYNESLKSCQSVSSFFHTYDYANQLSAILKEFDDVYIYLLEDLRDRPKDVLSDVYDFLGLDYIAPNDLGEVYNRSGYGKRSWAISSGADVIKNKIAKIIPEAVGRRAFSKFRHLGIETASIGAKEKEFLKEHFKDVVIKTEKIIDRDLTSWLNI